MYTAPVACAALTGRGLMVKIGAGCGPGCKYKALIITAATPPIARAIPIASRGRPPKRRAKKERAILARSNSGPAATSAEPRSVRNPAVSTRSPRFLELYRHHANALRVAGRKTRALRLS